MSKTDNRTKKDMQALRRKADSKIDTSDLHELDWSKGERGRFYRLIKQMVSLRIDADILAWFKSHHPKYQTAVNEALRDYIKHQ